MGAICCCETGEATATGATKKPTTMMFQSAGGTDSELFHKAFTENDIPALVALMDSMEEIKATEKMHVWAENPRTIGALAGTQMSIRAAIANGEESKTKDQIREAGAIEKYVEFLRSKELDRVHTAVVALSFLCTDNSKNAMATYNANALPLVIPLMMSNSDGLSCMASSICRSIIMQGENIKRDFIKQGGAEGLVKILEVPSNVSSMTPEEKKKMLDFRLEAMLTLCDFLEDSEMADDIVPEYAQIVVQYGVREKIEALYGLGDGELEHLADDLIANLNDAVENH